MSGFAVSKPTVSSVPTYFCRILHLFLGKSTKTAASRDGLFHSNMHQIVCQRGFAPDPTGKTYSGKSDNRYLFNIATFNQIKMHTVSISYYMTKLQTKNAVITWKAATRNVIRRIYKLVSMRSPFISSMSLF